MHIRIINVNERARRIRERELIVKSNARCRSLVGSLHTCVYYACAREVMTGVTAIRC